MPGRWQICFDDGHQQRYLPDRQAVLRYVLAIGPRAGSKRFEVFTETAPVVLSDGAPGGRAFSLTEVIDLDRPGETERLRAELAALDSGPVSPADGPSLAGQPQGGRT